VLGKRLVIPFDGFYTKFKVTLKKWKIKKTMKKSYRQGNLHVNKVNEFIIMPKIMPKINTEKLKNFEKLKRIIIIKIVKK